MTQQEPETLEEFAKLPGVGKEKLARYGASFIEAMHQAECLHSEQIWTGT